MTESQQLDWARLLPDMARRLATTTPDPAVVDAFIQEIRSNERGACLRTGTPPGPDADVWTRIKEALIGRLEKLAIARPELSTRPERAWAVNRAGELLDLAESYLRAYHAWPQLPRPNEAVLPSQRAAITVEAETVSLVSAIEARVLQHLAAVRDVSDGRILAGYWGWLLAIELGVCNSALLYMLVASPRDAWVINRDGVLVTLDETRAGRVALPALSAMVGAERIRPLGRPKGTAQSWLHQALKWMAISQHPEISILRLWRDLARGGHDDLVIAHWRGHGRMRPMSKADHDLYWHGAAPKDAIADDDTLLPAGQPGVNPDHRSEPDLRASRGTIDWLVNAFATFEADVGKKLAPNKRQSAHDELIDALDDRPLTGSDLLVAAYLLTLFRQGQNARKPFAASSLRRYAVALARPLRAEFGLEDLRDLAFDTVHERLQRALDAANPGDRNTLLRWIAWLARTDLLVVDPRVFSHEASERGVRTGIINTAHWRALYAWLQPVDPNGVARALLDCYFLLGMRPDEALDLRAGELITCGGDAVIRLKPFPGRTLKTDHAARTLPLGLLQEQSTTTVECLQHRAAQARAVTGGDPAARVFHKREADKSALQLVRGLRAVTGHPDLSLHSLRHSAAHLGLWQLLIQAGCVPKPVRERCFRDPLYTAEAIHANWPEIQPIPAIELKSSLLVRLAQRMGHGSHEVTCTHYLHVPEAWAWMGGLARRFEIPKAELKPWLGDNTWAYTRIQHIETASGSADPAIGEDTVRGLPADAPANAGVQFQGAVLWENVYAGSKKPQRPAKHQDGRGPTRVAAEPSTDPFLKYLDDAQSELFAIRATTKADAADTAFRHDVFEALKRTQHLGIESWSPFEIAQHRWRVDLVEWTAPEVFKADRTAAIDAFLEVSTEHTAVITRRRTLQRVLRVVSVFRVPVSHVVIDVRTPQHFTKAYADARVNEFQQAAGKTPQRVGQWCSAKGTGKDIQLHLRVTDPKTPWSGLRSACVWLRCWLECADRRDGEGEGGETECDTAGREIGG
ncbi:MAG: hypothetical protein FKY71_04855 [Spiribacter salinus]|uniref:Tyrosine-type recombinase/integrase n=1 Tax=Spiribacter salinus TaxID=1335746 RepID=A0A540VTY5_9GAMM|nr:MAG: hypothetical protein FKY71_04855 [Spiribacter salinus]